MAFSPSPTTGLGTAANILTTGNINPGVTKPGKNGVKLSLSGTNYPTTFQLKPQIVDVAGTEQAAGVVLVLTSVAATSPAAYTLTAAAAAVAGSTVYTGTITGGASNAYAGRLFTIAGFDLTANNGTFECTASSATTLTLSNAAGVADTHAGTAQDNTAVAVYTGTITGGGSNAFAGQSFVIAGFTGANNNGEFTATASSTTTLTLTNLAATAETHAATATEQGTSAVTYVAYGAKGVTSTYIPSGTPTKVATVSAAGLITAGVVGQTTIEISYPTFNNSVGLIASTGNIMNGLPINKIYAEVNVEVLA